MQGASEGFTNPFWLEGHFIVFNEDMFGIIAIEYKVMITFHRSVLPPPMQAPFEFYRMNELAGKIATWYRRTQRTSLIFLGTVVTKEWIKHLEYQEPSMFRSELPIFMPKEFVKFLELRLDTHVIFYTYKLGRYILEDVFTVNGGLPIILNLGMWDQSKGVQLEKSKNRWDRRTNLSGATFINALEPRRLFADFIYDENDEQVGIHSVQ